LYNCCIVQLTLLDLEVQRRAIDSVLRASRVLARITAQALADAGDGVTPSQYRALTVLSTGGPQRLAALATALGVTPSTATRMCDRLVAKGLVAREPDSGDRRQIRVVLTELGQGTVDDLTERRRIGIGRVLSVIPTAEQMAIAESLGRLAAAGEEQPE